MVLLAHNPADGWVELTIQVDGQPVQHAKATQPHGVAVTRSVMHSPNVNSSINMGAPVQKKEQQ